MSGRSNGGGGGVVGSIPGASKKMVQSLKEIVNCPELEIYAMLKECNMDPNETVNRLLSQDPFHEVKSKREKKKENKDESRSRATSSSSTRGGWGGVDRYSSRGSTTQYGSSDSGASRGKLTYKKDNGLTTYTSSATGVVGYNMDRRPPPVSDVTTNKTYPTNTTESILPAPPQSSFQSAWGGMPGQVSMADIVKMGRPHAKTAAAPQRHTNDQRAMMPPGVPGPHDLPPSQNYPQTYPFKGTEINTQSRITGSHHVPPNDDDDDWPVDEEPPAASVSNVVEPSADLESYGDHYDRTQQQYISPLDDVRYAEDDNGDDGTHSNFVRAAPGSNQNVPEDASGSASGFDNEMYQNMDSYQAHHQEVEDAGATVSSVTTNFQKLSMPEEEEDSESEDDGPAVKIPDHLQVQSADCSHLSFGSFGSGMNIPFSGPLASKPLKSNDEEAPVADSSSIGHSESRNAEYYENEHLKTAPEGNDAHRMGADSDNHDSQSISQQDMSQQDILKQEEPEVAQGNQYSFPSSTDNYAFENNQQLNASYAHSQTGSQMQGLPSLSSVMPYSNSLPSALLSSNVQPLRESELAYSPFPVSQSVAAKYNNSASSISNPAVSITEAMKSGNYAATQQPTPTIQGSNVSGGHALPQHLLHPYSQPSVPMAPFAGNLLNYQYLPQNYPYMPSAFQQAFPAGNSNYPQSIAAVLPQYKNSVSVSSLPQSGAIASGYGAAFGNSNSIPNNFPLNPPAGAAGTSMSYDDLLSSQYKDASHLLSLQQGPGSRTVSGVPGSTYYSFQGQNQQPAGYRQSQQPSQHYGPLSGYPNYYHSQGGPTLEQQLQMSRDGSLGGSQGQQPKQTAQQIWQNSY